MPGGITNPNSGSGNYPNPTVPAIYPGPGGSMTGNLNTGGSTYTWDATQGAYIKTPAQRATDLGGALNALQSVTGLSLLGSAGSSGGGGAAGSEGIPAPVEFPDTSAARAASFARAKDTAAQTSGASIKALQGLMAATGRAGSRVEGSGLGQIIGSAGQGVNELSREQAVQDVNSENQQASQAYSGAIAQRGQNIQLAVQEAARRAQAMQGLISAIGGAGILY